MKARRTVVARVREAGQCRYYRAGREFVLNGFTPNGLCDSAYAALSRDAQTLAYGGALPWAAGGVVTTRCPDPHGAVWELHVEDATERRSAAMGDGVAGDSDSSGMATCSITACRGLQGQCRFSVMDRTPLEDLLRDAVQNTGWDDFLRRRIAGPILPHHQLRVAIAACPNACSQPQVKDIGLVAHVNVEVLDQACSGCGQCVPACREEAITTEAARVVIHPERCLGCGQCVLACSAGAIQQSAVRLRLQVGGRLGRHPRWATEIRSDLCPSAAADAVGRVLSGMMIESRPDERFADTAERIGPRGLQQMVADLPGKAVSALEGDTRARPE
ncbi:MAG: 4Fe-4S binding protein [Desulfovibrionaceae bacterium]|nr:4Fe-4S binding protein [Desulfovibrionaceae bacterium]